MSTSGNSTETYRPEWDEVRASLRRRLVARMDRSEGTELDDLVQEGCVRLLRVLRRERVQDLEEMISVIAQRTFTDYLRRRYRNERIWEPLEESHGELALPPLADPDFGDLIDRVEFVVQELFVRESRSECAQLAQAWFSRSNWKEVADQMGAAHTLVRKRWSRCLEFVRKKLADDPDFARLLGRG